MNAQPPGSAASICVPGTDAPRTPMSTPPVTSGNPAAASGASDLSAAPGSSGGGPLGAAPPAASTWLPSRVARLLQHQTFADYASALYRLLGGGPGASVAVNVAAAAEPRTAVDRQGDGNDGAPPQRPLQLLTSLPSAWERIAGTARAQAAAPAPPPAKRRGRARPPPPAARKTPPPLPQAYSRVTAVPQAYSRVTAVPQAYGGVTVGGGVAARLSRRWAPPTIGGGQGGGGGGSEAGEGQIAAACCVRWASGFEGDGRARADALAALTADSVLLRVFRTSYDKDGPGFVYWFAIDASRCKCGHTDNLERRMAAHRLCFGAAIQHASVYCLARRRCVERLLQQDLRVRVGGGHAPFACLVCKTRARPRAPEYPRALHESMGGPTASPPASAASRSGGGGATVHREVYTAAAATVAARAAFWRAAVLDDELQCAVASLPHTADDSAHRSSRRRRPHRERAERKLMPAR